MRYLAISLVLVVALSGLTEAAQQITVEKGAKGSTVDAPTGRVFSYYCKHPKAGFKKVGFHVSVSWEGPKDRFGRNKWCALHAPLVFGDIFGKFSANGPWIYLGDVGTTSGINTISPPDVGARVYRIDVTCYTDSCKKSGGFLVGASLEEGPYDVHYMEKLYRLSAQVVPTKEEILSWKQTSFSLQEKDDGRWTKNPRSLKSFGEAKGILAILHRVRQIEFIASSATFFPEARKPATQLLQKVGKVERQILSFPLSNYLQQARVGKHPPRKAYSRVRQLWRELQKEVGPLALSLERLYYKGLLKTKPISEKRIEEFVADLMNCSSRERRENRAKSVLGGTPPLKANPD